MALSTPPAENPPKPEGPGAGQTWDVVLHGRYLKDFSFENPGAPTAVDKDEVRVDLALRIDVRRLEDFHEVALTVTATAAHEAEIMFLVELSYAGLFEMAGLEEEPRQRFAFCEAPRILFPFVDRIIADVTRDGGHPPLNLTPPDFAALYRREREATAGEPA